jgi:drug/metabolite transporter (DMT)-like permease
VTVIVGVARGGLDLGLGWPAQGWLIALALGAQVAGWLAIGYALPRLPAAETATIVLLQPSLTLVWGALIFGERPSTLQIVGAVVVLAGVGFVAFTRAGRVPTQAAGSTA